MLVEFSIIPIGNDGHISREVAEAVKIVDESGLPYQLTPTGTCIEGDWDEVMRVIRRCHERVRQMAPHLMTMINIEDEQGVRDKLKHNIASVEQKVGHPLEKIAA